MGKEKDDFTGFSGIGLDKEWRKGARFGVIFLILSISDKKGYNVGVLQVCISL